MTVLMGKSRYVSISNLFRVAVKGRDSRSPGPECTPSPSPCQCSCQPDSEWHGACRAIWPGHGRRRQLPQPESRRAGPGTSRQLEPQAQLSAQPEACAPGPLRNRAPGPPGREGPRRTRAGPGPRGGSFGSPEERGLGRAPAHSEPSRLAPRSPLCGNRRRSRSSACCRLFGFGCGGPCLRVCAPAPAHAQPRALG